MSRERKKFRDTKVGQFLADKAPNILNTVGDVLPDKGVLGIVKNLISNDSKLSFEEKMQLQQMLAEQEAELERNISDRWQYDMSSKSWLAQNVRPLTLLSLLGFLYIAIILDGLEIAFSVREIWIRLYETVLLTAIGGYFIVRSVDKNKLPWQK